ncbi:hypothetical protein [Candidatus Kryptonium thompsonii]|nr:hypothetical protein [Candidatus Kryptonium thompsoni]CUS87496.1 hypothetical protein JGI12_01067 [Candidatus Kryptonium thompsoni]
MLKTSTFNASSLGNCPFLFVLIFFAQTVISQNIPDFHIISQSGEEIVIEYSPYLVKIDSTNYQNELLLSFLFLNTTFDEPKPGEPQIPVRIFPVALKSATENSVEIIESSYIEYESVK